jgi:hypothetical protein
VHVHDVGLKKEVNKLVSSWTNFMLLGIGIGAACEGLSVKSYLSKITTLSAAHISTQGLHIKNPKRQREVMEAMRSRFRNQLTDAGFSELKIESFEARRPTTPLAVLAFELGIGMPNELRLTTAYAERLDALAKAALTSLEARDLQAYRACLAKFMENEANEPHTPTTHLSLVNKLRSQLVADDMASLHHATGQVLAYALLAFLAAIDLEWLAHYATWLRPTPTFHWLLPRLNPDFDPALPMKAMRNLVAPPARHLLTLCSVVTQCAMSKNRYWPKGPPGPTDLTHLIGLPEVTEPMIRKIITGQKKITLSQAVDCWRGMLQTLPEREHFDPPMPWLVFALWSQEMHVKRHRIGQVTERKIEVLDEHDYKAIWGAHLQRWADHLPPPGEHPWPEWMLAQSSWLPWMQSSQSSGRSSSPRDCQ